MALPAALCGQSAPQQPPASVAGPLQALATRVDRAPKLDGTLNDPLWEQAQPVTDFRQKEPTEGQPATEKTEVRILYTHSEIYFGIYAHDSNPKGIIARQLRRDSSQENDDYFSIIIDSSHNRRNAYIFQVNPNGTQRDGLIVDEQDSEGEGDGDSAWDGIWTSEARITPDGWTATIAIPFATLNFLKSHEVIWGINFKRFIRRKNEIDLWAAWQRRAGLNRISQAGELRGVSEIGSGRLFIIKPFGLLGFEHLPPAAAAQGLTPGFNGLYTGGVDMKIGIRTNLVANITANTDFADAEVDTQQFNLSPYKIFYPEKRQFFLENAGIFNFSMGGANDELFFSRQIGVDSLTGQQVPINVGAKLTGALAGFDLGFMEVDTRSSGPNPFSNFLIGRIKRSLPNGSYIGAMGIDKRSSYPNDPYNQSGGVDSRIVLGKYVVASGYAAETRTPDVSGGQSDVGGNLAVSTNPIQVFAERRKIGANFNPLVGFLARTDCVCDFLSAGWHIRPKIPAVREFTLDGDLFHADNLQGLLQTQEVSVNFRTLFQNGAFLVAELFDSNVQRLTSDFNIYKNVVIPIGYYRWDRHQIWVGSPPDRRFSFRLRDEWGTYYNGTLNTARVRASYVPNEKLLVSAYVQWDRFRLPVPGGNFSVLLSGLETDYAFNRNVSLATFIQSNTANTQALSGNVRLRWNYRPDSDFFIIYTAGQQFVNLANPSASPLMEHRFALKLTYSFLK